MPLIEVDEVQPTARECRAMTKGWGLVHWACFVPIIVYPIGFIVFGFLAMGRDGDRIPPELFAVAIIATSLIWVAANWFLRRTAKRAQQASPTGLLVWRWRIDGEGFVFDNGLQRNQLDWRAVKAVLEEKDRFLFLVTPGYNPVLPTRLLTPDQKSVLRALIAEVTKSGRLGGKLERD